VPDSDNFPNRALMLVQSLQDVVHCDVGGRTGENLSFLSGYGLQNELYDGCCLSCARRPMDQRDIG
jgi:hypothetical protein